MARNETRAKDPGPEVACPACGRRTIYRSDNPWRPFCSQRCKTIDLGAWASEQYRIAGDDLESAPGDGEPG
ncbi:MAG: DNA gyrase inhibitor YacG [Burkholderiaceae bacterium]